MGKQIGRLISFRTAANLPDFHATVYGFPLSNEGMDACLKRVESLTGLDPVQQALVSANPYIAMFSMLQNKCKSVWPEPKKEMEITVVHHPGGLMVMALLACTSPNNEFIPKEEDLQKVADVLAEEGFTDKPGWFWVRE